MSYAREDIRAWKGRSGVGLAVGGNHPAAQFTDDQVRVIKRELRLPRNQRRTHAQIAEAYGVKRSTIDNISRGRSWSHIHVEEDT